MFLKIRGESVQARAVASLSFSPALTQFLAFTLTAPLFFKYKVEIQRDFFGTSRNPAIQKGARHESREKQFGFHVG
jgi:hypothetical protein